MFGTHSFESGGRLGENKNYIYEVLIIQMERGMVREVALMMVVESAHIIFCQIGIYVRNQIIKNFERHFDRVIQ